jgi:phage repressor protein C with HTH and peptisase S24 domain
MLTDNNNTEANAIPIYGVQANIDTGQTSPKAPEPIPANAEIIPIVPSEVSGEMGIDIRKYVEKNADELDSMDPTKLLKIPDIAEQVAGTSMLPTFAPGDVVFIKFLPDKAKIIDGKTYYFDLRTLPTMIRKVKFEDGDRLRLVAKNPAFADIIINRSDILNIGRVIGMFRQTFGDQYDEIEEVRRRKDGQIDKLIDQNAKALESIGNLVDVIRNR